MSTTDLQSIESRGGTRVNRVKGLHELIHQAGFDFEVEKAQLYTPEGDELENTFMLRRTDTKKPLNVVRGRYQIVSNEEMLEPFDQMVNEYGASYENAGIVRDGRICWVSALLPNSFEAQKGDKIEQRIVAMVYHDGTRRNSYFQYTNRVWCNNQLRSLNREARKGHTVGHTANWQHHLAQARDGFVQAIEGSSKFSQQIKGLTDSKMTQNQAECFLQHMFPITKEVSDRVVTRQNNIRENVHGLFNEGAGNSGETRWDMLNAVTEYYDHHRKSKSRNASKQFVNEMTGMGSTPQKTNALKMLLNTPKFSAIDPKRN
jgi:phage/plasmid-like protein (TIGR03299 family)